MRHSSSDDDEMLEVDSQALANLGQYIWGQFMDNESSRLAQKKYKDHSDAFNAYLLINNYVREKIVTEKYVKTWLENYILYMKPDINFKDQHTERNFYHYIVRDKVLNQKSKVCITSTCFKVYDGVEYLFSRDSYDYTPFHYAIVAGHYKLALQMLAYWASSKDFNLQYQTTMDETHEFHDHPLTFFIWKNAENGVKTDSKREQVLKLLLKYSDNDVLLIKNKDGFSAFEYWLNFKGKKNMRNMIEIISDYKIHRKYLFMVSRAKPLARLNHNLKLWVTQYLA